MVQIWSWKNVAVALRRSQDCEAAVDFRILGPFEVENSSGPLVIRGTKRRSLLALFATHPNEVLSRDRVIEHLWTEPVPGADHTVQTYVSQLRRMLDGDARIETVGRGYRFTAPTGSIDAGRFLEFLRVAGDETDASRRRELLCDALACWRGPALEEFAGAPWADAAAHFLEQRHLEAVERRIDVDLELGRARDLLTELEQLVRNYPLAEPLWAQRMLALYRCGRQADALRAYGELRNILATELGIEPSRALAQLEQRILDQDETLLDLDGRDAAAPSTNPSEALDLPTGTVTFLLTDIVSSTELWELRPAEMAAAVREHESLIAAVIDASEGHLLKHRGEGDSTLSVFDRAIDAVNAAIDIQDRVESHRDRLTLPIALRIALHTGEVEQRDRDYFGRALNRAARIRALAGGDDILCSRITADLVADSLPPTVGLVDLGTRELRGLRRSEVVFRVRRDADAGERRSPERAELIPRADDDGETVPPRLAAAVSAASLVGRDDEWACLLDSWQRARGGERQVAFITGEPGIGKTRVAAEMAFAARREGAIVLYGRCDEGLGVPFQPFVESLRAYVDSCSDVELSESLGRYSGELVRLVPELANRAIELAPPLHSDPATEQYRLFDAVTSWLHEVSRRRPVLLVLDDLHNAADPTLLLLRHVASSERLGRVLVVATHRASELAEQKTMVRLLTDLRSASAAAFVTHLELKGLDEAAVTALVGAAGERDIDEPAKEFSRRLHAHTGGNPFFVNEILRNLVEAGLLGRTSEDAPHITMLDIQIPAAAREIVLRRVARLSGSAQQTLALGAVIGDEFELAVLEAVSGTDTDCCLEALEEAAAARLVTECALDRFSFSHALVRGALYDDLTESRRVRLHQRVGDAIERIYASDIATHVAELAYHYASAEPKKAVEYAIAAADAALETLAFEDAINVCERAQRSLDTVRGARDVVTKIDECDLLLRLGRAEFRAGRSRARDTLQRSFAIARECDDHSRMADSVLAANRGFFARMGSTDRQLVEALEQAIDAQPSAHTAVFAELLAALASELEWAEDGDRRFALSDRALAMAREVGELRTLAHVLSWRQLTITAPDTLVERIANCEELLTVAEKVGDPAINFQAAWSRGPTAVESGDLVAVDEMVDLTSQLAEELRRPTFLWQASFMRAARAIVRGELAEAERLAAETLQLGERAGQGVEAFLFYNEQMLEIRRWQDRLPEIIGPLRDFAGNPASDFGFALTRYLFDAGEVADARECFDMISRDFRVPPRRDLLAGTTVCNLAYLATHLGDVRLLGTLYESIRPYPSAFANTTVAKPVGEHFLGLIAAAQHDLESAERHFERALGLQESLGTPLLAAETRLEWARILDPRTASARRTALLRDATAAARAHGAAFIERRAGEISEGGAA